MNVLKELERFISSEEEIDSKAQDAKDVERIKKVMKKVGVTSLADEKIEQVLDDEELNDMDVDRFAYLLQRMSGK